MINLQQLIKALFAQFKKNMTASQQIVLLALSKENTDFTDDRIVPDEVSCAYAVTTILHEQDARVPIKTGTDDLDEYLAGSSLFKRIMKPVPGCIVVSPTNHGSNPQMPNGHTGIYVTTTQIMSNSSADGLFKKNYTRATWRDRYYTKGGYPVRLYLKIA